MSFEDYANAVRLHEMAVIDRSVHVLFWLKNSSGKGEASCREIADLITKAGLPDPNVTRLSQIFKRSKRVVRTKKSGYYKLHPASEEELERAVGYLFAPTTPPPTPSEIPTNVPFFSQADVSLAGEMSEIFVLIHCLENSARNLIRTKLETAHGIDWWDQVKTTDMEKRLKERLREEQKNKWHQPRGRSPLHYLDFGDLKDLICNNWQYFKDIFPEQHWIVSRLSELEKSRNVIAHSNVLADNEISRIRLYFGDWCRQLGGII